MSKSYSLAKARSSDPTRDNDTHLAEELSKLLADDMSVPGGGSEPAPAGEVKQDQNVIMWNVGGGTFISDADCKKLHIRKAPKRRRHK